MKISQIRLYCVDLTKKKARASCHTNGQCGRRDHHWYRSNRLGRKLSFRVVSHWLDGGYGWDRTTDPGIMSAITKLAVYVNQPHTHTDPARMW